MVCPSPLFVTGTARSGSTLLARALECSGEVALGIDAALPAFRSLRTASVRAAGLEIDDAQPLEDYYFDDARTARLDAVVGGDLSTAVIDWPSLRDALARRAGDEAADLVPAVRTLAPATYRELFDGLLESVRRRHGADDVAWVGLKDVWTIEFVEPLARAFPDARFVVIVRDPRGVLASIEALGRRDPDQAGHPLSYLRHWRKQHAFLARFAGEGGVGARVHLVLYDRLVADPEGELEALAAFLGLRDWRPMLAVADWRGNSSFGPTHGIDPAPVARWRDVLPAGATALAVLVCGLELAALGFAGATEDIDEYVALDYLRATDARPTSWRSDLGDSVLDHRLEVERRELLAAEPDDAAVRRAFLFRDAYRDVRDRVGVVSA